MMIPPPTNEEITEAELERILTSLSPDERKVVEQALSEQASGTSTTVNQLRRSVYEREIPQMDVFLYEKTYLGLPRGSIYPAIEELLWQIDKPDVRETYICAGKGSGKSTLCTVTMVRAVYRLMSYRDVSSYFRLIPDDLVAIVNMSISAPQAENVMFTKFWNLLENSGCFRSANGTPVYEKRKRHIEMSKNIHVLSGHSGFESFFGYNIFCGVMDEASWFRDTQDNPVSEEVYQGILASGQTRFPEDYKILAISSPQSTEDFLYRRVDDLRRTGVPINMAYVDGDSYAKSVTE